MNQIIRAIGIAWYHPEDYDACLRIMADRHTLPGRFDVWLAKAEAIEKERTSLGYVVVRAFIDPKTFPDWCRSRGLNVDSQARMEYANLIAKENASGGN